MDNISISYKKEYREFQLANKKQNCYLMKNITGIIVALLVMITFSSCKELITDEPQSKLIQDGFFNSTMTINEGILGCYAGMANIMMDEWRFTENRSDNGCVNSTGTGSQPRVDLTDIKFFRTPTSQPLLYSFWYKYFQNILNINSILPSVEKGQVYVAPETLRSQYEGELSFMRGYHYFILVNLWGDMFKITKVVTLDEAKTYDRRPVAEIYKDIIIPDLIKAAAQLPSSYTSSSDLGRVTKWAAKGMLAKAYMTLGGTSNLALAKGLLEEIINSSQYNLLTTGITVAGTALSPYASIFDVTNELNREIIFSVRYLGGASGIGSPFWTLFAPDGTANLFLKVGTPGGHQNPTPELAKLYAADPLDTRTGSCFKVYVKNKTTTIYYPSKYMDPNMTQANQSENDWIVLRLADVILLHAEIMAQDGNFALAHIDVNKIRARAGIAQLLPFTSPTAALDAVYKERRLEFAFEDQRWFDLLRMNTSYGDPEKAISILKTSVFVTDWAVLYSLYNPIVPPTQNYFTTGRLLLPIPQQEIDSNDKIKIPQNADY